MGTMPAPHVLVEDLFGCAECNLPRNHPVHIIETVEPAPPVEPAPQPIQTKRERAAITETIPATATLIETRDWLTEHRDDGVACPACDQFVKVYRRQVNKAMVLVLAAMYRAEGTDWVNVPHLSVPGADTAKGGDFAKMRYWNLIERLEGERPDGSNRVGWWRVTDFGVEYLHDRARIQKYALTYSQECIGLAGKLVGVRDGLGSRFNYDELMDRNLTND